MRRHFHHHRKHFYGLTTLGEKGQVVIPAEAREALSLEKGEKLLVFGLGKQVIALTKLNQIERILGHLENKLENLREVLRKTKHE